MAPPTELKSAAKTGKMPRLPSSAKVMKRPLLRPAIASPYAGKQEEKVVYVSSKMPFMSAVNRVKYLFKQIDKREMQAILDTHRKKSLDHGQKSSSNVEPVILKGTGKAIPKTLSLAAFFQKQPEYHVEITTSSIEAIDDIELPDDAEEDDQDLPESRIRLTSVVEVRVTAS